MESIKDFDDLPYEFQEKILNQQKKYSEGSGEYSEQNIIESFNQGQFTLAKEVIYYIKQIQSSIEANDGSFEEIINDLKLDLLELSEEGNKKKKRLTMQDHLNRFYS